MIKKFPLRLNASSHTEAESVPRLLITAGAGPWPRPRAPLPALLQFDFDVPICKSMNNLCCPLIACGGAVAIVVALDANGGFGLLQIAAAPPLASAAPSSC